jgi:hypothetical protein
MCLLPKRLYVIGHGNFEVRKLQWKDSASKCVRIYKDTIVIYGLRLAENSFVFIKEFFEQMVDEFNMK